MASQQELLRSAWHGGRKGDLSPLEQARAWGLREAWLDSGKPKYGMVSFVCGKVKKNGGGHPLPGAISKLFAKIDGDADWFPGQNPQESFGRARVITPTSANVVAQCAMAMKARGEEVMYPKLVAACPKALENPETGEPVGERSVFDILRERCYDDKRDKEDTWDHLPCLSKWALPDGVIHARLHWAKDFKREDYDEDWLYDDIVWSDICNSILPRSTKKANEQAMARKAAKGWRSKKTKLNSKNLKGKKEALKQRSLDTIKVWWAPVLTRGKLHLELLGDDFDGETEKGAAQLVAKVRTSLNIRFKTGTQPRTLFVDRGNGFWNPRSGQITAKFKAALREHGLKTFYGDDASVQPGSLQEVLLHETAVAWVRRREKVVRSPTPCEETVAEFGTRLRQIAAYINANFDVEGLCRALPKRVQMVINSKGDRICK